MLKSEARRLLLDRVTTRYPKSTVMVLAKLLDLIYTPDWRKDKIEDRVTAPKRVSSLAYLTNLDPRTVSKALVKLTKDQVISAVPGSNGSYRIHPDAIKNFASKYLTRRSRQLERKILTAVRMRFVRNPERTIPPFSYDHPLMANDKQPCACAGFCSLPCAR